MLNATMLTVVVVHKLGRKLIHDGLAVGVLGRLGDLEVHLLLGEVVLLGENLSDFLLVVGHAIF